MSDQTFYRNRETGIVQSHPVRGIGDSLNSDEIGEDGKPVKPYVPLGASAEEANRRAKLASSTKTTDASGDGDSKKGVQ